MLGRIVVKILGGWGWLRHGSVGVLRRQSLTSFSTGPSSNMLVQQGFYMLQLTAFFLPGPLLSALHLPLGTSASSLHAVKKQRKLG